MKKGQYAIITSVLTHDNCHGAMRAEYAGRNLRTRTYDSRCARMEEKFETVQ